MQEGHRNQSDVFAQMLRFFPWVLAAAVGAVSLVVRVRSVRAGLASCSRERVSRRMWTTLRTPSHPAHDGSPMKRCDSIPRRA